MINVDSQGHKMNKQMLHTLVKYLSLPQLLIYPRASIVDEKIHILDGQNGLLFQPIRKIKIILV